VREDYPRLGFLHRVVVPNGEVPFCRSQWSIASNNASRFMKSKLNRRFHPVSKNKTVSEMGQRMYLVVVNLGPLPAGVKA
jgi:hypothetical protein